MAWTNSPGPSKPGIIAAQLHGIVLAFRHNGYAPLTADQMRSALAEVREITTAPELLAHTAGLLRGVGRGHQDGRSQLYENGALILIEAGAGPPELVEHWASIGYQRATGKPFSDRF